MTNGIQVGSIVCLFPNSSLTVRRIGKVVGMEESSDRLPADIQVVYKDNSEVCQVKTRVDLVRKVSSELGELVGVANL